MLYELLKKNTGNNYLFFSDAEHTKNKWQDDLSIITLSCYYESIEGESVSLHFTTTNFVDIEIRPVFSSTNEKIRVEASKTVHQISSLIKSNSFIFNQLNQNSIKFIYSDLIIDDFDSYEKRISLPFLFENKKEFLSTYHHFTEMESDSSIYESERHLALLGKDGSTLAYFLKQMGISEIIYEQDEFLSVISFNNPLIHSHFHINYFKQLFSELGYTCHFVDTRMIQNLLHPSSFLYIGGYHDLSNYFTF